MAEPAAWWDFFLIHAAADKPQVRELYDALDGPFRTFLDEVAVRPGDNWVKTIDAGVQATRVFVVLISRAPRESSWYGLDEVVAAIELHRRDPERRAIVPVFMDGP